MKNLRLLLVLSSALFIATPAVAQIRLGPLAGRNSANLGLEDADSLYADLSTRAGLAIGAVIDIGLNR